MSEESECNKSESGEHEADFEHIQYSTHIGTDAARFTLFCLHCGALAEPMIYNGDLDWSSIDD